MVGCKWINILGAASGKKTTVISTRYRSQLNKVEAEVINKGLNNGEKILNNAKQDYAKPHFAKIINEKIEFGWDLLPFSPYSPDLTRIRTTTCFDH